MDPQTISERTFEVAAGMRVSVRAATFSRGGQPASAITLIVAATSGWFTPLPDDAGAATALMSSADCRTLADALRDAAEVADAAAPGVFD